MHSAIINFIYLIASVMFIYGIKGLTHPRTAVRGNILGALAMFIAVAVTLFDQSILSFEYIIAGIVVGSLIGAVLSIKIQMTAMPQLVAIFNAFGGGASVFVAGAALMESGTPNSAAIKFGGKTIFEAGQKADTQLLIATVASGIIGAITFWGSLVAFAKLQELFKKNIAFPGQQFLNAIMFIACIVLGVMIVMDPPGAFYYWMIVAIASLLGIFLVVGIGGADMPVVIALLNSYSGIAATATGFVLQNNVLIIAGSLVGASGIILTTIMCKAMNRSLVNVLFGKLGPTSETASADDVYGGKVKAASPDEVAMLFDNARSCIIVPGYGLAVAQAQHAVRDLMTLLESMDCEVNFAIHPVAGRMPGHMNVLLAEANVPYDKLKEMEEANTMFAQTDVALVIGANDVVNPEARENPKSPIAGMPILDVDKARTVVVVKRSLSPGFAGIPNPLFAMDNTLMMFGDGKAAILELITAIKEG